MNLPLRGDKNGRTSDTDSGTNFNSTRFLFQKLDDLMKATTVVTHYGSDPESDVEEEVKPVAKKRKAPADPSVPKPPKKPSNAFIIFCRKEKEAGKGVERGSGPGGLGEATAIYAERWKGLDESEKQVCDSRFRFAFETKPILPRSTKTSWKRKSESTKERSGSTLKNTGLTQRSKRHRQRKPKQRPNRMLEEWTAHRISRTMTSPSRKRGSRKRLLSNRAWCRRQ